MVINGVDIQTVDEYYLTHLDDIKVDSKVVTLSIRCDDILLHLDDLDENIVVGRDVPEDGIILPPTKYVLRDDDTVFDILNRAIRFNRIQMEYKGSNSTGLGSVYIEGISFLYEFSCGPLSGWCYLVDGQKANVGCSSFVLSDGQVIEWVYICDFIREDTNL